MVRIAELKKQVRRLTAFGTVALLGVGAWALLLAFLVISGARQLNVRGDRLRLERAAVEHATDLASATFAVLATGDSEATSRAALSRARLGLTLDSVNALTSSRPADRQRTNALRAALRAWDSTAARIVSPRRAVSKSSAADSAMLASRFAHARQVADSVIIDERSAYGTLVKTIALGAAFAAVITLGVVVLIGVLRRFARDVMRQGELVEQKQHLLEEQATQLRQRADSLERVNRELETALRARDESEALLQSALSSAPMGFAFLDLDLRFRRVNQWLAALNGLSVDAHLGRRLDDVHAALASALAPYAQQALGTRESITNVEITLPASESGNGSGNGHESGNGHGDANGHDAAHRPRYLFANFYPIVVSGEELIGVGAIVADVSERRNLEEQVRQSQKMEAIGRLAGGVAHDFNNLLTAIGGFSEFALGSVPAGHPAHDDIEQALNACHRGGTLTRQLLAFSRQQVLNPTVLSLNDVIVGLEPLLRHLIGADVHIRLDLDPRIGVIKADKGQIEQVLMNVVLNARDAMPNGGRLSIETGNIVLHDGYVQQGLFRSASGPHVMLRITDSGVGMDAPTRARIFEPFFTTKAPGKGTGLGLATVYGIVKQSGGSIWVYSEPGAGTTFKLYFPAHEGLIDTGEATSVPMESVHGEGYVLVVDDDDAIRALAVRALRKAGFEILEAKSGAEGLELARAHAPSLRAIVADLAMPGMDGREMLRQLREQGVVVPTLFVSGWTAEAVDVHAFLSDRDTFLEKPFSPDSLARAVYQITA